MTLSVVCAGALLLAIHIIHRGVQGLNSPPVATYVAPSSDVDIGVEVSSKEAMKAWSVASQTTYIQARYFGSSFVSYTLWFPVSLAGRRFVLELAGDAAVSGAYLRTDFSDPEGDTKNLTEKTEACGEWELCQMIYGSIPRTRYVNPSSLERPGADQCSPGAPEGRYAEVVIEGVYEYRTYSPDWAHETYSLPSLEPIVGGRSLDKWNDAHLDGLFTPTSRAGCRFAEIGSDLQVVDANPAPTAVFGSNLMWSGDYALAPAEISARMRNAESKANQMLAEGAAFAALAIAFMPVAYEAGRELWSAGKESAAAKRTRVLGHRRKSRRSDVQVRLAQLSRGARKLLQRATGSHGHQRR